VSVVVVVAVVVEVVLKLDVNFLGARKAANHQPAGYKATIM
jgi:hypothetical protein